MQRIITLIILFAFQCGFAQSASEYASSANASFMANNYAQAKQDYLLSLAQKQSAVVNYNLANTCQALGEIGLAKAYYMRAIYQNPRLKEAIFNLEALDKKYALNSFNSSKADAFFDELSRNEWLILASSFLWSSVLLIVILPLLKVRKPWQFFLGIIFLAVFVLCAFGVNYWARYANCIVATADNAPLRISPTNNSEISATLKAGQFLDIKKQVNGFYLLEGAAKKAWVGADDKNFIVIEPK